MALTVLTERARLTLPWTPYLVVSVLLGLCVAVIA